MHFWHCFIALFFVLSACSGHFSRITDQDRPENTTPIIGISQGENISLTRTTDGGNLSVIYENATIAYSPNTVMPKNGKHRFERSFTLVTGKIYFPVRFFVQGYHIAPKDSSAMLSFFIGDLPITIPSLSLPPSESENKSFFLCFDATLTEKYNFIKLKAELSQVEGKSGSLTINTIDIAVIDEDLKTPFPEDCTKIETNSLKN